MKFCGRHGRDGILIEITFSLIPTPLSNCSKYNYIKSVAGIVWYLELHLISYLHI